MSIRWIVLSTLKDGSHASEKTNQSIDSLKKDLSIGTIWDLSQILPDHPFNVNWPGKDLCKDAPVFILYRVLLYYVHANLSYSSYPNQPRASLTTSYYTVYYYIMFMPTYPTPPIQTNHGLPLPPLVKLHTTSSMSPPLFHF
jgi:hypothetical protein